MRRLRKPCVTMRLMTAKGLGNDSPKNAPTRRLQDQKARYSSSAAFFVGVLACSVIRLILIASRSAASVSLLSAVAARKAGCEGERAGPQSNCCSQEKRTKHLLADQAALDHCA